MHNRVIITREKIHNKNFLVSALFENNRLMEASCDEAGRESLLDNIYIGRVKRISEKIDAAFVEIAPGRMAYLPLHEGAGSMAVRQQRPDKLTQEDEIVVQVVKEAVKTKDPVVTTNISFKGNALILTSENKVLGISKKIAGNLKRRFLSLFAGRKEDSFGLIVRTNAVNYSDEQLLKEFEQLHGKFLQLLAHYKFRSCYSCLFQSPCSYISNVRDYLSFRLEKIMTDDATIWQELKEAFLGEPAVEGCSIDYYEDPLLSLSALYGLKHKLEEALMERVWLKSGAYLIIQPTEALTVIDVNSGKCTKGSRGEFYLKINLEAAEEIARQLRLRNISGICIVDFISMDSEEMVQELVHALKKHLGKDRIPAEFIDFTNLGLAEITRKKVKKPLWEQVHNKCSIMS